MRCIFCKQNSRKSKTIEHIIPESLGNKEHILPAGIVCDNCNNYFALKIEKPMLELDYFRQARFRNVVCNKEGNIPTIQAFYLPDRILIEIMKEKDGKSIYAARERDEPKFINSIRTRKTFKILYLEPPLPDDQKIVSRFLGKVAIEALASIGLGIAGGIDEIVDKTELDELRNYVRIGNSLLQWPFHIRRIYPEDKIFYEKGYGECEILHSFTLLYTKSRELYLVLVMFGIEYCINIGGPEIDGYLDWLKKNSYKSPLRTE